MICDASRIQEIADDPAGPLPKQAGVYAIVNCQTGRAYIGQSRNIAARMAQHKTQLRCGKHQNLPLQEAWRTYGESSFRFGVVALVDKQMLADAERELLSALLGDALFNRSVAGRPLVSDESMRRINVPLRLPEWLVEWIDQQPGTRAAVIEAALMRANKLREPTKWTTTKTYPTA